MKYKLPKQGQGATKRIEGKNYARWYVSFRKVDAVNAAKRYRVGGLNARIVEMANRFAPKGVDYVVYVYGSVFNLRRFITGQNKV